MNQTRSFKNSDEHLCKIHFPFQMVTTRNVMPHSDFTMKCWIDVGRNRLFIVHPCIRKGYNSSNSLMGCGYRITMLQPTAISLVDNQLMNLPQSLWDHGFKKKNCWFFLNCRLQYIYHVDEMLLGTMYVWMHITVFVWCIVSSNCSFSMCLHVHIYVLDVDVSNYSEIEPTQSIALGRAAQINSEN